MNMDMQPIGGDGRTLGLAGGHNFRDLGGYHAAGGKQVARGRLFRSGTLAFLTDDDHRLLEKLNIRFICDLRTNRERHAFPSRWIREHSAEFCAHDHDVSRADIAALIQEGGLDPSGASEAISALYRRLPYEQAPAYQELLRRIAAGALPAVFHCSAGKDRTGVFGAILLDLLGVDRETVVADYVLSDEHFEGLREMFMRDRKLHDMESVDPVRLEPLLRADPSYLQAMFDEIDSVHGSIEAYVRDVLEISDEEIAQIRQNLLV